MASIFTRIIQRQIAAHIVAETSDAIAFLDIAPVAIGHTLIVPKEEVDYLFDLSPQRLASLMQFAQQVAHKLKKTVACQRVGVMVLGFEVPHAHIHLIPLQSEADLPLPKRMSPKPAKATLVALAIALRQSD